MRKLATVLALVVTTAQAATWVRFAHDAESRAYEYDHETITHHDNYGRTMVTWTRTRTAQNENTTTRYELHCASRSYRITQQYRRDHEDRLFYQLRDPGARWESAVPDGVEQVLIRTICGYYR